MYVPRTLETFVTRAAQQFPVLLLTGARQVGKTTLLRHLSHAGRAYVTLDDPLVLTLAKTDPALLMQRFPPPVLIDEIQYATELLPYIKMAADRAGEPGLFWLTGSQQFHLMKGVSESLAGRVAGCTCWDSPGASCPARAWTPRPSYQRRKRSRGGAHRRRS